MSKADIHPFPGLRAFQETEGFLFFGRDGQSEAILKAMRRTRLLAVVGASGSGKSSLIRAGLIPYLHGGFLEPAGSRWRIVVMRPGAAPINALAEAIVDQGLLEPPPEDWQDLRKRHLMTAATLRRGGLGLTEIIRLARLPAGDNLLFVVDQFEELFRFDEAAHDARTSDEAAAFVKLLIEATRQTALPVYIVLTMRSDFIGDCARFRDLPEIVTEGLYLVPRLTRAQRREVIEGPIRVAGGQVTPRLVSRVLNDIGDDPDQLPILQHAMMRAWDHWLAEGNQDRPVDLVDYEAMGGAAAALSNHADEAFGALDARGQAIARKLFQCLTEKDADNRESRRPTRLGAIAAVAEATLEETIAVVETFRAPGRSFLMPPVPVPLEAATVLDISHESLIRNWRRLRGWVAAEAESARIYRRLSETAMLHAEGSAGLWRDPDLAVALAWRERERPSGAWAARYNQGWEVTVQFLDASRAARDEARAADAQARRREIIRNRWLMTAGTVAVIVFAGLAWYGIYEANAVGIALEAEQHATAMAEQSQAEALAAKARAERGEQDAKQQTEIAQKRQAEAQEQTRNAEESILLLVKTETGFAATRQIESRYDEALTELAECDHTVEQYNQRYPNDRVWIPQRVDILNKSAAILYSIHRYDEARDAYKATTQLVLGHISVDPAFLTYRLLLVATARGAADVYRHMTLFDDEIAVLQAAKASLASYAHTPGDYGTYALQMGILTQRIASGYRNTDNTQAANAAYAEMFDWYKRAFEAGELAGANRLGTAYRNAIGTKTNLALAIDWFTKAAQAGDAEAADVLGQVYREGIDNKPQLEEAAKWLRISAERGSGRGMADYGYILDEGSGVPKDEVAAAGWYRKAAALGISSAQVNLGLMYAQGRGVEKSEAQAAVWYRRAAMGDGNIMGQYDLGYLYASGKGVEKNEIEAFNWFRKAADAGNPAAAEWLGYYYENGRAGIGKSDSDAFSWYRRAAYAGNVIAEVNLGRYYEAGLGTKQDYAEALRWYRKAAYEGDAVGEFNVGHMYREGHGVVKDLVTAMVWFRKSAAQGDALAAYDLGLAYEDGNGADKDLDTAVKWYLQAANDGNASAAFKLGYIYSSRHDSDQALRWYRTAVDRGSATAAYNLGIMYGYGTSIAKNDSEALQWFRKAASLNSTDAEVELGLAYEHGKFGLQVDLTTALDWFREGAESGDVAAEDNLGRFYELGLSVDKTPATAEMWYRRAASTQNAEHESFDDRVTIADAARRLCNLLVDQGRYEEASQPCVQYPTQVLALAREFPDWHAPKEALERQARVLSDVAYHLMLGFQFKPALQDAELAASIAPDVPFIQSNRADAYMVVNRTDEARAIYLKFRGTPDVVNGKSWEESVLADFADLREAGLHKPLMDEITTLFAPKP